MRPNFAAVLAARFWQSAILLTSVGTAIASPPAAVISAVTSSMKAALRAETATFAPCCAQPIASLRPMPGPTPVTITVLPCRIILSSLLFGPVLMPAKGAFAPAAEPVFAGHDQPQRREINETVAAFRHARLVPRQNFRAAPGRKINMPVGQRRHRKRLFNNRVPR